MTRLPTNQGSGLEPPTAPDGGFSNGAGSVEKPSLGSPSSRRATAAPIMKD